MKLDQFQFREPPLTLFANRQKVSLFRWLTRKVPPIFLCGGDVMTIGPMVTGYHEPEVLQVLAFLAQSGFNRALIDVGANIGLMTYGSRDWFQAFHCFEPNPRVFNVMTANLATVFAPDGPGLHLHNFGLGDRDETSVLSVPRHNQGAAFIAGSSNAYGADVLQARKQTGSGNTEVSVTIRRARDIFAGLFGDMPSGGFVVKIDTEGYEQVIIREIAAAMPAGARIAIVFENLQPEFDAREFIRTALGGTGRALKLADNIAGVRSRFGKEFIKLTRGKAFRLTDQTDDWLGTVILIAGKD
jgi:FkbM family methyltransferase